MYELWLFAEQQEATNKKKRNRDGAKSKHQVLSKIGHEPSASSDSNSGFSKILIRVIDRVL